VIGLTAFGRLRLNTAPCVAALENATGRRTLVFGKPAQTFFGLAVSKLGVPAGEVLMVGDDVDVDLKGALRTGKFARWILRGLSSRRCSGFSGHAFGVVGGAVTRFVSS
jgi:ribonucleotide monophosphatase NagD (HAD superfamily)